MQSASQFHAAVAALAESGGTIALLPHVYSGTLVVGPRSERPLRIVGRRGVRIERLLFDGARRVSLERVTLAPVTQDALVEVRASSHVELRELVVTGLGTRYSASVLIPDSRHVAIRRSTFTHCGDRAPVFVNCVLLYRWARHVTIEDSRFHDCYGCDFIHGRFHLHPTVRWNPFRRACPRRMARRRCGHQGLIQLFAGRQLRV